MILHRPGTWVCYEVSGEGPAIVLVHAISAGRHMWNHHVQHVNGRATVITFDARGVGDSGNLTRCGRIRDQIADDIAEILDAEGVGSAFVCGVSFGGVIAQNFAVRHPEKVDGLMVVDSYGDSRPLSVSRALWLASVYAGSVSNFLPRTLLAGLMRATYSRWTKAASVLAQSVLELRPWQAFRTRNGINLVNFLPDIAQADYPVWFVVGLDSWWRSRKFAQEFAAAVPRTQLIEVPDSADPTPLCQPDGFTSILTDALDSTACP